MSKEEEKTPYHHGDLRNSLITAGEKVLRADGVSGLSLREVAKAAGVSHSAPYRHFKDKNTLLQAIAAIGFNRLEESQKNAANKHLDDPRAAMLAGGEAYVELAVSNPETTQLMFAGVIDKTEHLDPDYVESGSRAFAALLALVEMGIKKNIYKSTNNMEIALTVWASMHGLSMLFNSGDLSPVIVNKKSAVKMARTVCELMMSGLEK